MRRLIESQRGVGNPRAQQLTQLQKSPKQCILRARVELLRQGRSKFAGSGPREFGTSPAARQCRGVSLSAACRKPLESPHRHIQGIRCFACCGTTLSLRRDRVGTCVRSDRARGRRGSASPQVARFLKTSLHSLKIREQQKEQLDVRQLLKKGIPEGGLEPPRGLPSLDFESSASPAAPKTEKRNSLKGL